MSAELALSFDDFYAGTPLPSEEAATTIEALAEQRIAGLLRLREYAHEPGVDVESFLRRIRIAEREHREDQERATNNLGLARQRQKDLRRARARRQLLAKWDSVINSLEGLSRASGRLREALAECRADLTEVRQQRLEAYVPEWEAYIESLAQGEHASLVAPLKTLWASVSRTLWAPEGGPFDDGFLLTWDRDNHRLQMVLEPSGEFGWSYYDRDTQEFISEEGLFVGESSEALVNVIARLTQ